MSEEIPTPVPPPPPARKGMLGRSVLPVSGIVILALVVRWIFGLLPGQGTGTGTTSPQTGTNNSSQTSTQVAQNSAPATLPTPTIVANPITAPGPDQALQIAVSGDRYLVDNKDVTIDQIVATLSGGGKARIILDDTSRKGAQKDLEDALDAAKIQWREESGPSTGP